VKNILVIDEALNAVDNIFAASDKEFSLIFPPGQDLAFLDQVLSRGPKPLLDAAFNRIRDRTNPKRGAMGIHGALCCELEYRKQYSPTRRDVEARNPDGLRLRRAP
jgi:hypothetical protein